MTSSPRFTIRSTVDEPVWIAGWKTRLNRRGDCGDPSAGADLYHVSPPPPPVPTDAVNV